MTRDALAKEQPVFPLDVYFCENCTHVQLSDIVSPSVLFEDYVYVSGTSPVFVRHFEAYAQAISHTYAIPKNSLVVDIGSNDGTLLKAFKAAGHNVLGIDPARNIAQKASEYGIETLAAFFTPRLAATIRNEYGTASVVTANNVFAHIDDLSSVVDGVRAVLGPEGVFSFEVSYLLDVFEKTLFDTIYHEHLSYHTVKPLRRFLSESGMELICVERVPTHGGSIRVVAQHKDGPHKIDASVDELIALEHRLGLDQSDTLLEFSRKIDLLRANLSQTLENIQSEGKRIVGFGAPAKATTLLYHFGLGPSMIEFIVDDSPLKQGLYSPGMHIPILPVNALYEYAPDYAVILAWNFSEPIIKNHARFRELGHHFIVPLPEVQLH